MTERRPFPPSPRRLSLARQAGLTSASPLVVGALAAAGAILAAVVLARAAASMIGSWIADACRSAAVVGASSVDSSSASASHVDTAALASFGGVTMRVLELAAPILAAAAIIAIVAHVAQTRALWLPRRRIPGAPVIEPARVQRGAFDIGAAVVIGAVAFGWLWTTAPRLASLFVVADPARAVGSALASLVVALAFAWIVLGVLDALVRRAQLTSALAMTVTEKREDDRLAAADPRWRAQRALLARGTGRTGASESSHASTAIARAAVLLLGDDIAVAIAWDTSRQPVPARTITGRRAHATQLVALARRHRVPVHRDAQLAAALVDGEGPVPDTHWARLAEIIAAVQAANTGPRVSR